MAYALAAAVSHSVIQQRSEQPRGWSIVGENGQDQPNAR